MFIRYICNIYACVVYIFPEWYVYICCDIFFCVWFVLFREKQIKEFLNVICWKKIYIYELSYWSIEINGWEMLSIFLGNWYGLLLVGVIMMIFVYFFVRGAFRHICTIEIYSRFKVNLSIICGFKKKYMCIYKFIYWFLSLTFLLSIRSRNFHVVYMWYSK